MQTGYVAFLDVLGFSALVASDVKGQRLGEYLGCLETALRSDGSEGEVEAVVFSDSIVLTTRGDSESSLQALLKRTSQLFGLLLKKEIPIRGAISHGSFLRAEIASGVFVAGKALVDAYRFEQAQDWVGIMLAPSARTQIRDLDSRCKLEVNAFSTDYAKQLQQRADWAAFVQDCFEIPFHSTVPLEDYKAYNGFAVVPTSGDSKPSAVRDSVSSSLQVLNWLKSVAPDPAAQAKYQRTITWLYAVSNAWQLLAVYDKKIAN
jgi:hypothetical protein